MHRFSLTYILVIILFGLQQSNSAATIQTSFELQTTNDERNHIAATEQDENSTNFLVPSVNNRETTHRRNFDNFPSRTIVKHNGNALVNSKAVGIRKRIIPIMFMVPKGQETEDEVCSDSEEDFPSIFTQEQLAKGAVIVCLLIGIYCFTFLAIICDKYFLPSVERICEALNLSQDVAAATFMAMATASPEFFVNVIGTFITESDIGIGTVVGSNMYNTLGVSALGSLAASFPIQLDWWPVTRDCVIYICAVALLVAVSWDGYIYWYEGLIMVIAFVFYLIILFNNKIISKHIKSCVIKKEEPTDCENGVERISGMEDVFQITKSLKTDLKDEKIQESTETEREPSELFTLPKGSRWSKFFFIYSWPIRLVLFCMVPNPKTKPRLFPVTFVMCVVFIGANSYIVSWMLTTIGATFGISDAILGLTFLAFGGGLPESLTVIIMSRRGEGSFGVSNAIGANTVNILMSLGVPWFIKTITMGFNENAFIEISSGSIEYTILVLLLVIFSLFLVLYFNKFRLSRPIGIVLSIVYFLFLLAAVLAEVFFVQIEAC